MVNQLTDCLIAISRLCRAMGGWNPPPGFYQSIPVLTEQESREQAACIKTEDVVGAVGFIPSPGSGSGSRRSASAESHPAEDADGAPAPGAAVILSSAGGGASTSPSSKSRSTPASLLALDGPARILFPACTITLEDLYQYTRDGGTGAAAAAAAAVEAEQSAPQVRPGMSATATHAKGAGGDALAIPASSSCSSSSGGVDTKTDGYALPKLDGWSATATALLRGMAEGAAPAGRAVTHKTTANPTSKSSGAGKRNGKAAHAGDDEDAADSDFVVEDADDVDTMPLAESGAATAGSSSSASTRGDQQASCGSSTAGQRSCSWEDLVASRTAWKPAHWRHPTVRWVRTHPANYVYA